MHRPTTRLTNFGIPRPAGPVIGPPRRHEDSLANMRTSVHPKGSKQPKLFVQSGGLAALGRRGR